MQYLISLELYTLLLLEWPRHCTKWDLVYYLKYLVTIMVNSEKNHLLN